MNTLLMFIYQHLHPWFEDSNVNFFTKEIHLKWKEKTYILILEEADEN